MTQVASEKKGGGRRVAELIDPAAKAVDTIAKLPIDVFPDPESQLSLLTGYCEIRDFYGNLKTFSKFAARSLALRAERGAGFWSAEVARLMASFDLGVDDMVAIVATYLDDAAEGQTLRNFMVEDFGLPEVAAATDEPDEDIVEIAVGKPDKKKDKKATKRAEAAPADDPDAADTPFEPTESAKTVAPAKSKSKKAADGPLPGQGVFPAMDGEPAADDKNAKKKAKKAKIKEDDRVSYKPLNRSPILGRVTSVGAETCDIRDDAGVIWPAVSLTSVRVVKDDVPGLPPPPEPDSVEIRIPRKELAEYTKAIAVPPSKASPKEPPVLKTYKAEYKDGVSVRLAVIGPSRDDAGHVQVYAAKDGKKVGFAKPADRFDVDHVMTIGGASVKVSVEIATK